MDITPFRCVINFIDLLDSHTRERHRRRRMGSAKFLPTPFACFTGPLPTTFLAEHRLLTIVITPDL
jgi:hypothetical protein